MKRNELSSFQVVFDWLIFTAVLLVPVPILWKMEQLKTEMPRPIVYQVDNAGGVMVGTITDKEIIDGRYTVTAGAYGKFLVTKEQYESLHVGDEMPEYLKEK